MFFEMGEGTTGNPQMQRDTCCSFLNLDIEHFFALSNNSFGKAEAKRKIFQIGRGGQHHGVGNAVVLESDRHFLRYRIEAGWAVWSRHRKLNLGHHAVPTPVNSCRCFLSSRAFRFCHSEGWSTRTNCTAVTLYSGQLVAQSELSVVITLAPDSGKWKVV